MLLRICLIVLVLAACAWAAFAPRSCTGRVDVLALVRMSRTGHLQQPVYRRVGSLAVAGRPRPDGCAPRGGELPEALRARARKEFGLGNTPFILRFR